MIHSSKGLFINNAGKGRYTNPDAPEKLIKYITRNNKNPKDDLVTFGGLGVAEFEGIESMIKQFYFVQKIHTRNGNFGRYIDHEIYSFSSEEEIFLNENNIDIDKVAREMAYDFYEEDKCQVVYAVHAPSNEDKHLHIHFAINTVNYCTGKKRRENKRQTKEREKRFQNIVESQLPIA